MSLKAVLKKLSFLIILVVCILLVAGTWVSTTSGGLMWLYSNFKVYVPGELTISELKGSLLGTIKAKNITYSTSTEKITAVNLEIDWNPVSLFSSNININRIGINALSIQILPDSNASDNVVLPEIFFPLPVVLKKTKVSGLIYTQGDNSVEIKKLELSASAVANLLRIKNLSISKEKTSLNITGKIKTTDKYSHKLDIILKHELNSSHIVSSKGIIEGNIEAINIKQYLSSPLKMSLSAQIQQPLTNLSWSARLSGNNVDPGIIWKEWPGNLQFNITNQGSLENDEIKAFTKINQLSGDLRTYPVSLDGNINWLKNAYEINKINFRSGSSVINIDGRIDSTINLNWTLKSANIAELYPHSKGKLEANGKLTGTQSHPVIDARYKGKTLSLLDYSVNDLSGTLYADIFTWRKPRLNLKASSLKYANYEVDLLEIKSDTHNIHSTIKAGDFTANIDLKGHFINQSWSGKIIRANIISDTYDDWSLKSATDISIHKDRYVIEEMCLNNKNKFLCADFSGNKTQWSSNLKTSHIPLKIFSRWLPADLKIDAYANTVASVKFLENKLLSNIDINIPSGSFNYPLPDNKEGYWGFDSAKLAIDLHETGLDATADIQLKNGESVEGTLALPGFQPVTFSADTQSLFAAAHININELELIEAIFPEVQNVKGKLSLDVSARGTLARPDVNTKLSYLNGSVAIPRLGLNVHNINLTSTNVADNKLIYELTAYSAAGKIIINGSTSLDIKDRFATRLSIAGNDFELANIPEARVLASPDLRVEIISNSIKIKGDVYIPYAKLQPRDLSSAAKVSPDTVIVGEGSSKENKWLIESAVKLTLGDRIHFYGFGFEGRFAGKLLLEDKPGQLTKATGEITIPEGRYRAYGQRLDVEHGKILYSSSPVTNPGIDLRAVRNAGDVIAGIKVGGTLERPEIELFSIPAMGQTDALSYLVLGHAVKTATSEEGAMVSKAALALSLSSGDYIARTVGDRFGLDEMRVENTHNGDQASLIIGRYLSPKLYISYGVGLIESANTINLRYQLSEKWQIKSESGNNQSADLLYTIER